MHFHHLMLYYFRKGKNAARTTSKICSVYGANAVEESTVRKWLAKFKVNNFDLEDAPRSRRPSTIDDDQIMALIETNPHYTTRDIANILSISNSTVYEHLRKNNLVSRYNVWVPHDLTEQNLIDRASICDSLVKHNQNDLFFKQIITGDEKWVLYNTVKHKRSWGQKCDKPLPTPKAGLHPKKVMLCIW